MICFPNAKINLGLNVTEKRPDGFHTIETVFYPIGWSDALEFVVAIKEKPEFNLSISGIPISGALEDNLLYKAYQLIKLMKPLPSVNVYLHKALPMGAGLGGGSADAAFFINGLNDEFSLGLSENERVTVAQQLGSDCAFFIKNKPVFAHQKGDVFKDIQLDLSACQIAVIYPNVHSNTKEAYRLVKPQAPKKSIIEIIQQPISTWKTELVNDFETSIFSQYPIVESIKQELYTCGASYAAMSGSGSAVFGLFDTLPQIGSLADYPHWIGKLK